MSARFTSIWSPEPGRISVTATCPLCEEPATVRGISLARFWRWQRSGEHIQEVLPELSAGEREVMISGCHRPCFDELFPWAEEAGPAETEEAAG